MNHRPRPYGPLVLLALPRFLHYLANCAAFGRRHCSWTDPVDLDAIGARTDPELGAKGAVEIGQVAKAAIERDFKNLGRFGCQPGGSFPETPSKQVLMGSQSGQSLKGAKEMITAQARFPRQGSEAQVHI